MRFWLHCRITRTKSIANVYMQHFIYFLVCNSGIQESICLQMYTIMPFTNKNIVSKVETKKEIKLADASTFMLITIIMCLQWQCVYKVNMLTTKSIC
jgi:hypothetical protein